MHTNKELAKTLIEEDPSIGFVMHDVALIFLVYFIFLTLLLFKMLKYIISF